MLSPKTFSVDILDDDTPDVTDVTNSWKGNHEHNKNAGFKLFGNQKFFQPPSTSSVTSVKTIR